MNTFSGGGQIGHMFLIHTLTTQNGNSNDYAEMIRFLSRTIARTAHPGGHRGEARDHLLIYSGCLINYLMSRRRSDSLQK